EQALVAGHKKILALSLQSIDREIAKLNMEKFEPFLLFDESSFASRELFEQCLDELLPKARQVLQKGDRVTIVELNSAIEQLTNIPQKIQNLFQRTVTCAINTCNDTKLLKELLDLVSQA